MTKPIFIEVFTSLRHAISNEKSLSSPCKGEEREGLFTTAGRSVGNVSGVAEIEEPPAMVLRNPYRQDTRSSPHLYLG
jgi:hypothetical protein